jgi:predicted aspartyl protease
MRGIKPALLALAMIQAACPPPARAADCSAPALASFDIAYNAILIPVTLNGQGYAFMLDTGGYVSTLSPGVVDTLHLSPATVAHGGEMFMSDGTVLDQYVTVDELDLGQNKSAAVRFIVQPQQSRAGLEHFAGTLAPDFLHNFDLDFDFGRHRLNLMPPGQCGGAPTGWLASAVAVPFRTDAANHIVVPVKVDGVQTTAVIDTGASHTVMSEELARSAFHLAPGAGLEERLGATDSSLVRYEHVFQTLALNGVEIDDLRFGILPDEMAKSVLSHHAFKMADPRPTGPAMNAYPIIIGIDVLRKIHLYVDYKNETLYIASANAAYSESPPEPAATPATAP